MEFLESRVSGGRGVDLDDSTRDLSEGHLCKIGVFWI